MEVQRGKCGWSVSISGNCGTSQLVRQMPDYTSDRCGSFSAGCCPTFFCGDHIAWISDKHWDRHCPERNQIDSRHQFGKKRWQKFPVPAKKLNQHRCYSEVQKVISRRQGALDKERKNHNWRASAMTASTMAARKREPGRIAMVSRSWQCCLASNPYSKPAAGGKTQSAPTPVRDQDAWSEQLLLETAHHESHWTGPVGMAPTCYMGRST